MNPGQRNDRQRVNLIDFDPEEEAHIEEYLLLNPPIKQDRVAVACV
jgi:hypothetical protein